MKTLNSYTIKRKNIEKLLTYTFFFLIFMLMYIVHGVAKESDTTLVTKQQQQ